MTGDGGADALATRDQLGCIQAIQKMCVAIDSENLAELTALWMPDGTWDSGMFPPVYGREAIVQFFRDFFANDDLMHVRKGAHWVTNHMFTPAGVEVAEVRSYWMFLRTEAAGGPRIQEMGHYNDVLCMADGGWRFKSRVISRLGDSGQEGP